MKNKKIILTPVKPEDYQINFGGDTDKPTIPPELFFADTLEQLKILAIGPYFWFIADAGKGTVHSYGGMLEKILPIADGDSSQFSPQWLFGNTHPEDISQIFAFTNYWVSFYTNHSAERRLHLRPTIYIRLLNPKNLYKWVMVQYAGAILDNQEKILFGLTVVTDISHIKKDGVAMMSILDAYDDSCQLFYCAEGKALPSDEVLPQITNRELDVLRLLAVGNSSKQIASELKTAIKTIDNHRQNMLRKTGTKSTGELVAYGINNGYV